MKNFFTFSAKTILLALLCLTFCLSCNKGAGSGEGALDKDTSYAFGMFIAGQMGLTDLSFDYNAFAEGFRDFNEARETRLSQEQAMEKIRAAITTLQAGQNETMSEEGEKNLAEGEAYLAENGAKSGVTTTSSGLQYEVITQGSGNKPGPNDTVRVQYEGTLLDGTVFDSSYTRGTPAEFPVGGVISGWIEGLQLMNEGSVYRFVIPSNLAYGANPPSPDIPPNAVLIFKVELLAIVK